MPENKELALEAEMQRRPPNPPSAGESASSKAPDSHNGDTSTVRYGPEGVTYADSNQRVWTGMEYDDVQLDENSLRKDGIQRWMKVLDPWSTSYQSVAAVAFACLFLAAILHSFVTRQLDPKGCRMAYMRPMYAHFADFDTKYTPYAAKYNLYMYREGGIDEDTRVKGVPVLFIPGNSGSYKQSRSFAAEAANHYQNHIASKNPAERATKRPIDFFTIDFNEDFTAFRGRTLTEQADYVNEAVKYILSLYHSENLSFRDAELPKPSSVILIGHSMGGLVARRMFSRPSYTVDTVNTIITLAAPHARPPISFDTVMVEEYRRLNEFWRRRYSSSFEGENVLSNVTLISIAGGGLDTMVPSDYASVFSIIPETHGFTVFTSTIPNVWTGMDHLAITWCDQLRKSVVPALFEVIDVLQPSQVRLREERMGTFKKFFLTGLEDIVEKSASNAQPDTILTLENNDISWIDAERPLLLDDFGQADQPKTFLMPLPWHAEDYFFTLLTDRDAKDIDFLFCNLTNAQGAVIDGLDGTAGSQLNCKSAMADLIALPASKTDSQWPFDLTRPFSYFQYKPGSFTGHRFAAFRDKSTVAQSGFAFAELTFAAKSIVTPDISLPRLLLSGLELNFPSRRPMMSEVRIPALHSSLLAYNLRIENKLIADDPEMFAPLVRQYVSNIHESRFFVNAKDVEINMHGVAPYIPSSVSSTPSNNGLSLQIWTDPGPSGGMRVSLRVDILGSMGKLWMRYRTLFAALPLFVVALAMHKQFQVYNKTGVFMSFSNGLNQTLRHTVLGIFLILTGFTLSIIPTDISHVSFFKAKEVKGYTENEILLGTSDPFFWFLIPSFALLSFGFCHLVNWVSLLIVYLLAIPLRALRSNLSSNDKLRRVTGRPFPDHPKRLLLTIVGLLILPYFVPYQVVFTGLCLIQLITCVQARSNVLRDRSIASYNFYNYSHTMFLLLLWILPINLPMVVVWVRDLTAGWHTRFDTFANYTSVDAIILMVSHISAGEMIPRLEFPIAYLFDILLLLLACFSVFFGVSYAYVLHIGVRALCLYLFFIYLGSVSKLKTS